MTRSGDAAERLRRQGVTPFVGDALIRDDVVRALATASAEVVVHQLTALRNLRSFRRFDREFEATNALRTRGTDNLMFAAQESGVRHFVAQSYGSWIYEPSGTGLKSERDALDPAPPRAQRRSLEAIRHLEQAVTSTPGMAGVALRYGSFYGPGTSIALDGPVAVEVRKRRVPVIGDGGGVWSFVHVDDAATATIAAIEHGATGIYNIADDDPAPVSEWLPALAAALEAPPPRRIPVWLGRLAAGDVAISLFTRIRGMSNEKAKRELNWTPRYASWREGFRTGLAAREHAT